MTIETARRANGAARCLAFVPAEIVDDDDVSRRQRRNRHLLDTSQEALAVRP